MITLLYHGRQIGPLCHAIAGLSKGRIQAICDESVIPGNKFEGTLIRWDSLRVALADNDVNPVEAVLLSKNKRAARARLGDLTVETWFDRNYLRYPCIVRPSRHFAANKFFVCHNLREAREAFVECRPRLWYASPIIDKDKEYRVFVYEGKAIKVIRRWHKNPNEVAWNSHNGGQSSRVLKENWPQEVVVIALAAAKKIGLGWAAVDVIVDKYGKPFVLELNTAPGVIRPKTHELLAKVFLGKGKKEAPPAPIVEVPPPPIVEEVIVPRDYEKELADLKGQLDQWSKWGIIEIAVRNQSVSEYMTHWEGRTTRAEAYVETLLAEKAALTARNIELKSKLDRYLDRFVRIADICEE